MSADKHADKAIESSKGGAHQQNALHAEAQQQLRALEGQYGSTKPSTVVGPDGAITVQPLDQQHPWLMKTLEGQDKNVDMLNKDKKDLGADYDKFADQSKKISQEIVDDVKANGGHLTKDEYKQIKEEETQLKKDIHSEEFKKEHPWRADILQHLADDTKELKGQYGKMDANDYTALAKSIQSIHDKEQQEAKANGGHLTAKEYKDLQTDEKQLQDRYTKAVTGEAPAAKPAPPAGSAGATDNAKGPATATPG